ncbi:MAG TPA: hypothetical protein VHC19_04385 [Pirellulales bacterium]|nr:hypothetical protein [Pirellulales bacterium]
MPARQLLYYVSGHGYGHATRSAAIIREFVKQAPQWTVHVRTSAPPRLFDGVPNTIVHLQPKSLDPGVVEDPDALGVDVPATLTQLEAYYDQREATKAAELAWLAEREIVLIVADFPPLAGEIAAAAGLPCVGIGNFTWDWIYEPLIAGHERRQVLLEWIRAGYGRMRTMLRLPFSHTSGLEMFGEVQAMPLAARRATRDRAETLKHLGLEAGDERRRVVLAMRGRIPRAARERAARENPDCLFLHFETDAAPCAENMRAVELTPSVNFTDVLQVADVVVSKLGYGILSECIAAEKPILCPPRRCFREDEIFDREAAKYVRLLGISQAAFAAGDWRTSLQRLLSLPRPAAEMPQDGAACCARFIAASAERAYRRP